MFKTLLQTAALLERRERSRVLVIVVLLLGSVLLETVGVALVFPLVKILIEPAAIFQIPTLAYAYHVVGLHEPRYFLGVCAVAFLGLIILKSAYGALVTGYQEQLFHQISARLGTRLVARYLSDPWSVQSRRNSADLINVADNMSGWPLTNALRGYPVIVSEGLLSLAILALLLWIAPRPALLCIFIFGFALFVCHNAIRRRLMALSAVNAQLGSARIQLLQELLASLKEIKILGHEAQFVEQYAQARQRDALNLTRLLIWQNIPRALVEPMAVAAMTGAVLAIVGSPAVDPAASAAILGLFAVAGIRLTPSLTRMLVAANSIRASSAPLGCINADLAAPVEAAVSQGTVRVPKLQRDIAAEEITYSYPGGMKPVLQQLSLSISKGETVGLTGLSGGGKSTLADLLTGLLTPSAGSIRVDGADIAGDIKGWQQQIGYIPQTVSLIDATIFENIALGVKAQAIDAARMREAIALARLDGVVQRNSMGARLGERGMRLSGGERQRIGIARALYHGRSVLVMDEATSALDDETEEEIALALARLHGRYTILIIAHRIGTMRRCDRIMMLENGRISAQGSPREMQSRFA